MDIKITDVCFFVDDVNRSVDFYKDKIGLEIKRRDIGFAEFHSGEATFAVWDISDVRKNLGDKVVSEKGHWCIGAFQFETGEEVTNYYHDLVEKKVEFVTELVDWPWGARAAYLKDPDGFLWEIYAWVGTPLTW